MFQSQKSKNVNIKNKQTIHALTIEGLVDLAARFHQSWDFLEVQQEAGDDVEYVDQTQTEEEPPPKKIK